MADDHPAMIAEFQSITQENEDRSRFYLESANWQLAVALSSFYDSGTGPGDPVMDYEMPPPAAAAPSDMDVEINDTSDAPPVQKESLTKSNPPSGSNSRMRSLADYAKPKEDSDEEGQEFYAGGSEHSGEVIIGPGKKQSGEDIVKNMFKSAKRHGAVPAEQEESSQKKENPKYFTGGGYKLGETDTDHQFVPGAAAAQPEGRQLDVILKLWRDGFTVGDSPLRDYTDPENREFLRSVAQGQIPQELIKMAKGGEVNLDMEDHKNEEYKPVKRRMQPFTGEGHTLGTPTPTVVTDHEVKPTRSDVSSVDPPVIVKERQPTTTLRVQMGDGARVTQKFNHGHTVADLYTFVRERDPSDRHFVLMTTFPNKELKEDSASLKEANLLNAVIVQRYK